MPRSPRTRSTDPPEDGFVRCRVANAVEKVKIRRVSVLGSGKVREKDPVYQQAVKLGAALAQEGFTVFHGGFNGVMEAVAKGNRLAGGHNVGITIQKPKLKPGFESRHQSQALIRVNPWLDAEIKMPCWQSRLFKLVEMGDAYVFLDGATGTLAELFVVLEMTNRGLLKKPIIILGKKLRAFFRTLQKDPHFNLPGTLHFVTSILQTIKLLIGYKGVGYRKTIP